MTARIRCRTLVPASQATTIWHEAFPAHEWVPEVAAVVRRARREAADNPAEPSERLVELVLACRPRERCHLARTIMVRHPDTRAVATGGGAVWAVASRLTNQAAAEALRREPLLVAL